LVLFSMLASLEIHSFDNVQLNCEISVLLTIWRRRGLMPHLVTIFWQWMALNYDFEILIWYVEWTDFTSRSTNFWIMEHLSLGRTLIWNWNWDRF
jgi:hypothetical protein